MSGLSRRISSENKMNSNADPTPPLAVITGSARRLGKAIAVELARRGYAIGLHYHHSEQEARQFADELRAVGVVVELLHADLGDPAQIDALFQQIDALPFPLRVWVNSAAVMARGDLRTLAVEEWDAILALNLRAPWLCARGAAERMTEGGVIINLTDSGVHKTWSSFPAYSVSKAALETLTRLLAKTLAPAVRVNAVAPGLILRAEDMPEADWQRLVARLPLQQAGSAEDVARAVGFLVESEHITGETISVDGGYQLV
jgi:NAD(P)-dependent dehydrogenase (short-subunit alcohol dehydrogenase family)